MKSNHKNEFAAAKPRAALTPGEVIQMLRELKGWTQAELAERSGIGATNLSLLENGRIELGKRRVEQLARAFDVHPATILFPEYEAQEIAVGVESAVKIAIHDYPEIRLIDLARQEIYPLFLEDGGNGGFDWSEK